MRKVALPLSTTSFVERTTPMRKLALICCALALFVFAIPVFGQAENQTTSDPCMGTMDMDVCMWSDQLGGPTGGNGECLSGYNHCLLNCDSLAGNAQLGCKYDCVWSYYQCLWNSATS
jgi:hypothetical protein